MAEEIGARHGKCCFIYDRSQETYMIHGKLHHTVTHAPQQDVRHCVRKYPDTAISINLEGFPDFGWNSMEYERTGLM